MHLLHDNLVCLTADEADALFGKRMQHEHEVSLSMKTEFMSLWDGMDTDPESRIVIMGATNRPQELDPAVLRRCIPLPPADALPAAAPHSTSCLC